MPKNHPHPEEELYLNEPIVQDTPTSETNPADVTKETVTLEQPGKGPQPRYELPELRTPNRKVFRMSDGTHQAVYHTATVHAYNPDKKMYEEINTILTEEKDGHHYCNDHQHFTARFNRQETNNALFSIQQDNHSVTFYAAQTGKAKSRNLVPLLYRQNVEPSKPSDTLVFEEAMPGADLEYSVNNIGIKENILVKQKASLYHYAFDMHCENVTAAYNAETNTILYTDAENGEKVFCTPAPYMVDAAGQSSAAAIYHLHETADGQYRLTVTADKEWMNAEDRVFPVTIDPQINLVESSVVETRSWNDGELSEDSTHIIGKTDDGLVHRMCIQVNMPALPHNPRIKNATLTFTQCENTLEDETSPLLALYDTNGTLMDYQMATNSNGTYAFNVTSIVDKLTSKEVNTAEMSVQFLDESAQDGEYIVLDGVTGTTAPQLIITYDQNYGVGTAYRTHTHDLGRFGQGIVDLQCGNLMFESEDFAWSGNHAPITIRHLFNSALSEHHYTGNDAIGLHTADFTKMQLGYGWKLNIQQSMIAKDDGYVYVNENGEQIFFEKRTDLGCCHYASENDSDMVFNCENRTLTAGGNVYLFDTAGRLIRITDQHNTCMTINYASDQLISVTDGAGRTFSLAYNTNGLLEGIVAPDGTQISYTYENDLLTAIDYPDDRQVVISYPDDTASCSKPCSVILRDANTELHKTTYTFQGDRMATITEYGKENNDWIAGVSTAFSYSAAGNRTMVTTTEPLDTEAGETANRVLHTVYGFDDDGNVITEYAYTNDIDRTAVKEEPDSNTVIGVNSSDNLLLNPNFNALTSWRRSGGDCASFLPSGCFYEANSKFGISILKMQTRCDNTAKGMHQDTIMLPAGVYTFSAYVQVLSTYVGKNNPGAYLKVTTTTGDRLAESDRLTTRSTDYSRLTTTFELTEPASVQVHILTNGCGALYAGGAQLERRPYASPFNAIVNGNFEHDLTQWCYNSNASITDTEHFNMSRSIALASNPDASRRFCQEVQVKTAASTRETFTLSGWAKGMSLPENDRPGCPDPRFELNATIVYSDYTTESYTAPFSPATEEWQFASVQFCKEKYKKVKHVIVSGFYSHNANTAYFDSIQLVRNSIETNLSEEDFVIPSDDTESASVDPDAPTEDDTFTEVMDDFGNALTETTFTEGEFGTLYRAFAYSADGNNLVSETDTRGYTTTYTVDPETSRNKAVTDRCGNVTAYEYDDSGRTTKVTSKDATGTELAHVGYAYDTFDNLTAIARGDGMTYNLAYTPFHDLESIGVAGKAENLVTYTYKNGTGRLKAITYANGHVMKATYNGFGQMVAEKWYDAEETLIAHYKHVYDAEGNIVRSIDIFAAKAYDYTYDDGHVVSANAFDITLNGEMVTKRDLTHTIRYHYNKEGALTGKQINANGNVVNTRYTTPEEGQPEVTVTVDDTAFTSRSKNDHLGRKEFEELQIGGEFLSRQFSYHMGEVTDTHKNANKVKSTPTTQLVSQIAFSDGRTIAYEYDPEERITKVIDSVDGITEYTYDALGQLLTETVNGVIVNSMKYDNYGNIVERNGKAYTYGDAKWKDLLTEFDGKPIVYDAQGNPTSYLGHNLTWEKGRQLKRFDGIEYTYNANGIRTSKVVDNVKHEYVLDGATILKETWDGNTLIPVYDNEDSVCGIIYNGKPYYFQKNLQGDIISLFTEVTITDDDGQKYTEQQVVARYAYDAWGVCTTVFDTSGVNIAIINPFRYRGYYYDNEIGLYYLQSRYYNAVVGRFINNDTADMINMSVVLNNYIQLNLFTYCCNKPTIDKDFTGYMSANNLAALFSIGMIFEMFTYLLYVNYAKGLVQVGLYTTKIVTPVAAKAFWWKPWLIAAIVVAAVGIILAAIAIMYSNRKKEIEDAKKKIPGKLKKNGKVDLSKFGTRLPNGQGFKGPDDWKIVKDTARHASKVWKLYKKAKRIASLLEDGTIYGK